MIDRDVSFPASYSVREPDATSEPVDVEFATRGLSRLAPAFVIEVTAASGRTWRAEAFGGTDPLSRLVNGPGPDGMLAVAGGVGYVVSVERPEAYAVLDLRPVTDVLPAREVGLLVCVGLTKLVAVAPGGSVAWRSPRVAADGVSGVRITSDAAVVTGWDAPSHRNVETTLDLKSGEVVGRV